MSGGSFDYMYSQIRDIYCGEMEDEELNEMMEDLCNLLYKLEWYTSGDTIEEDYIEAKNKFKNKWFGKRNENLVNMVSKKLNSMAETIKKS